MKASRCPSAPAAAARPRGSGKRSNRSLASQRLPCWNFPPLAGWRSARQAARKLAAKRPGWNGWNDWPGRTGWRCAQDQRQAICLTKGCYTGQEIVARTHYLGKNKRRLERIALPAGELPAPGTALDLPDGRRAEWVLGVARETGSDALVVTASPG